MLRKTNFPLKPTIYNQINESQFNNFRNLVFTTISGKKSQ